MNKKIRPLRFYWIRHAPPINPGNICYGAAMDVDVSDVAALKKQAALIPDGALWVVSPMPRAQKTAQSLLNHHHDCGLVTVHIEDDLREQSFGHWVNLPRGDLHKQPGFSAYMADPENNAPPGGESLRDVAKRVGRVIDDIVAHHPHGGDVCLVSHKGTNRAALHHMVGIALKDTLKISSDPLSVTSLIYTHKAWALRDLNLKP